MIRSILAVASLLFSVTIVPAQSSRGGRSLGLFVQTGYFIPANDAVRSNYNQGFLIGNARIPVSLSLGAQYPYSSVVDIFGELGFKSSRLRVNKSNALSTTSILAGVRYVFPRTVLNVAPLQPYAGGGIGLSLASVTATYTERNVNGTIINPSIEESNSFIGYGAHLHIGADYNISRSLLLGFVLQYDLNTLGETEQGGLGNLGGLLTALRLTAHI